MVSPLLTEIAMANYHKGGLRAMRIGDISPEFLDELIDEAERVAETKDPSNVNQAKHVTNWTNPYGEANQWSLFNRSGNTSDTSSDFDYKNLHTKKPIGGEAIARLTESIPDLVNLRLNKLGPYSRLSPHEEHIPRIIDDERVGLRARFHIPLISNPDVVMLADDHFYHFAPGGLYFFNNGCVHAAYNNGDTPRFHLVFDVLMTKRSYKTLFECEADWVEMNWDRSHLYTEKVTEWAKSDGPTWDEFSRRTLTYVPA